jgi:hypothetical protein
MWSRTEPCEHCGGQTTFSAEMQPLGNEPGHHVFFCEACKRYTWVTWRQPQQSQDDSDSERR